MKKLLAVLCAVFCLGTLSFAEGINAGDQMVSGTVGFGAGLQKSGWQFDGNDVDWGTFGATFGASYMFFPSEYFGVGVEINDGVFAGEEDDVTVLGVKTEMENAMNVFNLMASFRANLNPQERTRFYIPFGAGLTSATQSIKETVGGWERTESASYNSFGWFVGLGFEIDLGQGNWSLGGEARYNAFTYDTDKMMRKVDGDGAGKKDYSYISMAFKASYRF